MRQDDGRGFAGMEFLIALGSNATSSAGDARATVEAALSALSGIGAGLAASRLYRTPCFPAGAGPDFVNAACRLGADLTPEAMLQALHRIEAEFGRTRQVRWGQRTLDLDLLAAGDTVAPDEAGWRAWADLPESQQAEQAPDRLILPHPRLQDRAFVLVPLADIAPDWTHPVLGRTVSQMLAARPDAEIAEITPI